MCFCTIMYTVIQCIDSYALSRCGNLLHRKLEYTYTYVWPIYTKFNIQPNVYYKTCPHKSVHCMNRCRSAKIYSFAERLYKVHVLHVA